MRGLFFASFGAMSWGISGVCSQYLFMNYELDSAWLTAIRMLLSGIVLLIISTIKNKEGKNNILKFGLNQRIFRGFLPLQSLDF